MNENHTITVCYDTYRLALELDGIAWRDADAIADSGSYHFEQAIEEAIEQIEESDGRQEDSDDYYDDSMDGDHESALASVYGDNDDFGDCSDF
jgi:hypothetical protein